MSSAFVPSALTFTTNWNVICERDHLWTLLSLLIYQPIKELKADAWCNPNATLNPSVTLIAHFSTCLLFLPRRLNLLLVMKLDLCSVVKTWWGLDRFSPSFMKWTLLSFTAFHKSTTYTQSWKDCSDFNNSLNIFHNVGHHLRVSLLSQDQRERGQNKRTKTKRSDSINPASDSTDLSGAPQIKMDPPVSQCHINRVMASVLNGAELISRSRRRASRDIWGVVRHHLLPSTHPPPPKKWW